MISSVHGLIVGWKHISREDFSPAHAAHSDPLLMHAMAVQSYRSSLGFFADADEVVPSLKTTLHIYWGGGDDCQDDYGVDVHYHVLGVSFVVCGCGYEG